MKMYRGMSQSGWVYGGITEDKNFIVSKFQFIPVDPNTVSENTKIVDKNGVEVFEGDIIKFNHEDTGEKIGYVEYDSASCSFKFYKMGGIKTRNLSGSWIYRNCYEVIGNIFDNPELLKEE